MKIGLTYDLKQENIARGLSEEMASEFEEEETIEAIENALHQAGFTPIRIGTIHQLVSRLAKGERFELVFNIAEGVTGRGRESQVPALLEAYQIPYVFSDPLTLNVALDKAIAKRILRDHGIPTAPFCVINTLDDCKKVSEQLTYPVFIKPIAEGSSMGISPHSFIHNESELRKHSERLKKTFRQPILVEPFLPGREFTVGILGSHEDAAVLGVMEFCFTESNTPTMYCYERKMGALIPTVHLIQPNDAEATRAAHIALSAWRALGCRDAGRVDLRSNDAGEPQVLEINPIAGLRPNWSSLVILAEQAGINYNHLIQQIIEKAISRQQLSKGEINDAHPCSSR